MTKQTTIWTGRVGQRNARVVRFKSRLEVHYEIQGEPGMWSLDFNGDAAAVMAALQVGDRVTVKGRGLGTIRRLGQTIVLVAFEATDRRGVACFLNDCKRA